MSALSPVVATPTVAVVSTAPAASANGSLNAATTRSAKASTAAGVRDVADEQRELIAAEPRRRVGLADQAGQPYRGGGQQFVADAVAHRVVHDLEIVQVHEQHAGGRAVAPGPGERCAIRSWNSSRLGSPVSAS